MTPTRTRIAAHARRAAVVAVALAALCTAAWPAGQDATGYRRIADLAPEVGMSPRSALVQGPDGLMYGTATRGGQVHGTVFRVDGFRHLTATHVFAADGSEGDGPGPLIVGSDGWLYGSTREALLLGYVWRLSTTGEFQMLYSFTWTGSGSFRNPGGPMARDAEGNLYVALEEGGSVGGGGLFRLAPDGRLDLLHEFLGRDDGAHPLGGVTLGPDGRLYGTARDGGTFGAGTVFSIAPDGSDFVVLHEFVDGPDGCGIESPLAVGPDGALYGANPGCGPRNGGVTFRVGTDGSFTALHAFGHFDRLGESPAGVSFGPDGTLYGTTSTGGRRGGGTVFRMTPDGAGTPLHAFLAYSSADGMQPWAAPTALADGTLWGTTYRGGRDDDGTVYAFGASR
ncbi:MAG TPA: choice-of-anchor tandem repeat GloVer-containing protein [Burkholderiaceae bacterium]